MAIFDSLASTLVHISGVSLPVGELHTATLVFVPLITPIVLCSDLILSWKAVGFHPLLIPRLFVAILYIPRESLGI